MLWIYSNVTLYLTPCNVCNRHITTSLFFLCMYATSVVHSNLNHCGIPDSGFKRNLRLCPTGNRILGVWISGRSLVYFIYFIVFDNSQPVWMLAETRLYNNCSSFPISISSVGVLNQTRFEISCWLEFIVSVKTFRNYVRRKPYECFIFYFYFFLFIYFFFFRFFTQNFNILSLCKVCRTNESTNKLHKYNILLRHLVILSVVPFFDFLNCVIHSSDGYLTLNGVVLSPSSAIGTRTDTMYMK